MTDTAQCFACSRTVTPEESKTLDDGRSVCNPCDQHKFKFLHMDYAAIVESNNPATNPYYTVWCSCNTWRGRRYGHPINDTDKHSKAMLDAYHAWREHRDQPAIPTAAGPAQAALF